MLSSKWKRCRTLRNEYRDALREIASVDNSRRVTVPSETEESTQKSVPVGSCSSSVAESDEPYSDEELLYSSDEDFGVERNIQDDPIFGEYGNTHHNCSDAEVCEGQKLVRPPFVAELANVALKHNMTDACLNDLSTLLRKWGFDMPNDARSILGTQRRAPLQQEGTFVHFGLESGIRQALGCGDIPPRLDLQASIDGLPLYKSSVTNFWPISCRVTNTENSGPFIVSVYCGRGKPPSLEDYLKQFIEELQHLIANGLHHKGRHVAIKLKAVICDAPARSFVKAVKGHNAHYGCERCTQRGTYVDHRMTFPGTDSPRRSDASFRAQENAEHHRGISPFLALDIDMVFAFPIE